MPSTTGYSFGDIVLVPFPFTDLTATKKRPAVVVSYHRDRRDVIVMAVTSQARPEWTPRFEPRERWPRRSRCAGHQVLVRGRPGAVLELSVTCHGGRKHLPVITLRRVA